MYEDRVYVLKCKRFPSAVLAITVIELYGSTIYSVNLVILTFGRRPL